MNNEANPIAGDIGKEHNSLRRMTYGLVGLQFFAAPSVVLCPLLPTFIGIGSFSITVDLRILTAILFGLSLALLVLLPFIFAWACKPIRWRALRCIPLLCLSGFLTTAFIIYYAASFGARFKLAQILLESVLLSRFSILVAAGIAFLPSGMRCWRGWQVSELKSVKTMSRKEAVVEWIAFAILVGLVFSSNAIFAGGTSGGGGYIASALGIAVGIVLCGFAFWLLRVNSANRSRVAFTVCGMLFVLLPGVCVWLSDHSSLAILPAGNGDIYLGFLAGALVLLLHVAIFRARGYRIQQFAIERPFEATGEKVVVDPFSD